MPRTEPSQRALLSEIVGLREELADLKREKADLELLMETNIEHSDYLEEDLLNKVESALRESEKRFRLISETIPVPITVSRVSDSAIVYANSPAGSLFGFLPECKVTDFYNPGEGQLLLDMLAVQGCVSNYEMEGKRADGTPFWAALFVQPLTFNNEPCRLTALYDLTDRKLDEEERMRLATAVEQGAESIIITDRKGNIEYVNPAFEQTFGYAREEITGRNFKMFKSDKHKEAFFREMWNVITEGRVWAGRVINRKKDGEICEFETTISPIRDTSGSIINFVSVNRDVTHELQMERQLRQAQKMEAIGTLATGISHDFNNILTAIFGNVQLAKMDISEENPILSKLDNILSAANRAKDLVMQVLTFCRQSEHEKKPLQISLIVKESLNLLRASIPATIEIRQKIRSKPGIVLADPTQMHQVLMNLCANAAGAMREKGGMLEVVLENMDIDADCAIRLPDLKPGPYLRLSVCDTGHGMSPEVMDRIFEPFYTTKNPGEGTGMGLAVVHGIVRSHGGAVHVRSEPGKGTVFHVYLPRISAPEKKEESEMTETLVKGHERILFVDDEQHLQEVFRDMLEHLGYEVVAETDSVRALELFRTEPDKFDIVITDQTMPNMTGEELAAELMRIRPDIPIILCTGYSERINEEKAKEMGIRKFLMKPFVISKIANAVREVLA